MTARKGVPALPEDVFAGVQPANDQTANDLHAKTAKPAFDPAEDAAASRTRRAGTGRAALHQGMGGE